MSQKNITRFANQTEYDTAFDTLSFPNVSYIDEGDEVRYMEENPYMITGTSTYTAPFSVTINNRDRTVTLKEGGDWELNVKPYLPLTSLYYFVYNKGQLTTLKFPKKLDTSNVTSMDRMFNGCSTLTSIDLSHFNTENVTDMSSMFYGCSNLTTLDVSHFNTSKVTRMGSMFNGCKKLTFLDVSHFNTANVTTMEYMFSSCFKLTSLDLSHFNTEKVTNMRCMFNNCLGITSLDLSNFNTANVTTMEYMFNGCSALTSLDLSNFNTEKVTNMYSMFSSNSSKLTTLKLCGIGDGTKNVDTRGMFNSCFNLANIPSCGQIHNSVDFRDSPLTLDSAKVILNALSTPYSGAQEIKFSTATKNLINADADAMALVEEKRSIGWTISL